VGDEKDEVADELRQVREAARRRARGAEGGDAAPTPAPTTPDRSPPSPSPGGTAAEPPPDPPDAAPVNAAWRAEAPAPPGPRGLLLRALEWILRPRLEAQRAFNSSQVQLDNALIRHVSERSEATHRHYDRILGDLGRRLDEADERHAMLERELVAHVQELVRRIDFVLADANRGRAALEFALEEVREGLARVEKTLRHSE
jgi:hypothetical protein